MTEEKTSTINEENLSKEELIQAVKKASKEVTSSDKSETEEKVYLLGFMPSGEVNGLVLSELGESFNLDRVKKLWLPKSQKMNQLFVSDMQLLDDEKMKVVIKDIDPKHSKKIETIETQFQLNPFWQANKHSIKMVKIDELITLQNSVNIDRANNLAKRISKDATVEDLLDYNFDFNRKPPVIHNHLISPNAMLFSSNDNDIRPSKIEVRNIPRYAENGIDDCTVPALVIPVVVGEPSVYCIRTYAPVQMPDGTTKMIYFLILQNGIHRAYALRSLGIEYMPCLIIDPVTAGETDMLMGNWSQERKLQSASQRPPLMKDFFNPELIEKFKVRKKQMCIKVGWTIEKFTT